MASLPTTTLGNTGIEVTRLGFGAALFHADKPHWTDQTAEPLHHQVLDCGINFIECEAGGLVDALQEMQRAGQARFIGGGVAQGEPGSGYGVRDRWAAFERAGLDELRESDESRSAFVLRFTLSHPHVHTIIVGTTRPAHLRENVAAVLRGPLPAATYAEAKCRLDAAGERPAPAA